MNCTSRIPQPWTQRPPAVLVASICACAQPDTDTASTSAAFVRDVVVAEHPLSLVNPQQHPITWPLWGGAFAIGELAIRASLSATDGAGLVIAGAGPEPERATIELVSAGDAWTLRETTGGETHGQQTFSAPDELVLELTPKQLRVGELALDLRAPLGPEGAEAGLYVTLAPGASLRIDELALTASLPDHGELGPPLRELAVARGLEIGTALDIWPPVHDLALESLLGEQFNRVAPTELYWPTTRGEDQDFFFAPADLAVNYALVHEQALTGMFLIWDFALPEWLLELHASGDALALAAAFDEHITTTVSRYAGAIDTWIVVNEAIWGFADSGEPADFAQTLWYDALGPDYIERAFELARAADPDATLLYNETGAEALGDKSDFMLALAEDFVARGVPIDGVGLQFHIDAASPPVIADVEANMQRFAALGLSIHITELDVSLAGLELPEQQARELQASIYADVLELCLAVPACSNWTVFGFSDRYAWDELGDASPLLFDAAYQPKPAFFAVQELLSAAD